MTKYGITELEKAYFAGFFDGEGCVLIHKTFYLISNKKTSVIYKLNVKFVVTYKQTLIDAQKLFGGTLREVDKEARINYDSTKKGCAAGLISPDNWKQAYHYSLYGWNARCFLKIIEPFCREKKEQVQVGIEFQNGKKSMSTSDYETKRGEFYYLKLQQLKKEQLIKPREEYKNIFRDNQMNLDLFE